MERRTRNLQGQSQIIFFFFMLSLAIVTMIIGGVITVDALSRASAALVPALVVGGLIGSKVAVRVRKDTFRVIVIVIVTVTVTVTVIQGPRIMGILFVGKALRH